MQWNVLQWNVFHGNVSTGDLGNWDPLTWDVAHDVPDGREDRMRVLGVDPGLTRCGLGVVEGLPGRQPRLIAVEVVRTSPDLDIGARLLSIEAAIEDWVIRLRPTRLAVERVFAQHNVQTVMATAQAAGVALLVAARHHVPVALHTPSEVKAAITGSGRAGKQQVGAMVTRILQLEEMPRPADAADALALAICHVWRGGTTARYDAAVRAAAERAGQRPAGPTVDRRGSPTPVVHRGAPFRAQPPARVDPVRARLTRVDQEER